MTFDQHIEMFERNGAWLMAEKERLLKIIRTRGVRKHRAWMALLEIANRLAWHKRELKNFWKQHHS